MRIEHGRGAGKLSLDFAAGRSVQPSISSNTSEMGVIASKIALIPVGPLPLAVGMVIALVVTVSDIQAPALFPIAI